MSSVWLGTPLDIKVPTTRMREESIHPASPLPHLKSAPQAANAWPQASAKRDLAVREVMFLDEIVTRIVPDLWVDMDVN